MDVFVSPKLVGSSILQAAMSVTISFWANFVSDFEYVYGFGLSVL